MRANELAECVNLTEIMDFKQEIRDFSYGTSPGGKHFGMKFKQPDCIFCLKLFCRIILYSKRNNQHRNQFIVRPFQSP